MEINYEALTDYAGADGHTPLVYQGCVSLYGSMYLDNCEYFHPITWMQDNSLNE
ncbi:hypothetical protein [Muribaculum intestinale]|uniref:hypothetical protein n=1 Tax=Muribaculum intestinale TaxID=1796646 RepID=UPI0025B76831|nr:hypothetical protein [Muribaculum intestinale]